MAGKDYPDLTNKKEHVAFQYQSQQIELQRKAELFNMVLTNVPAQCLGTVRGAE